MNRRELITSMAVAAVAVPIAAQETGVLNINGVTTNAVVVVGPDLPPTSPEELRKQFAICAVRGHRPTCSGSNIFAAPVYAIQTITLDSGPAPYPNVGAGEWNICWHCKTRYRFVTTMEESGKP